MNSARLGAQSARPRPGRTQGGGACWGGRRYDECPKAHARTADGHGEGRDCRRRVLLHAGGITWPRTIAAEDRVIGFSTGTGGAGNERKASLNASGRLPDPKP